MVVSRDADLFLFVLNRCRHVPGHLDSDVDGKGVGTTDRNRATGSNGPDLVLVAIALFGLSARRYVRSWPVLGCIFRRLGFLFAAEIVLGGIVPLGLLARAQLRAQPRVLFLGALLATLGVILNRVNVVLLAMDLKGPMPQIRPASYFPSVFEWGISV